MRTWKRKKRDQYQSKEWPWAVSGGCIRRRLSSDIQRIACLVYKERRSKNTFWIHIVQTWISFHVWSRYIITLHQWMQAEGARSAFRNVNSSDLKNSRSGLSRAKTNRHKTINTTNRYSNYIIPEWNFQRPTKMLKCMPYNLRLTSRKMEND